MKITETIISFKRGKKRHAFSIYHNLPNDFGLNIQCAFDNWLVRTDEFTPESLCEYIESKDPNFKAITEDDFLLMKAYTENHEKEKNTSATD